MSEAPVLETIDLEMTYRVGTVEVRALRGVNIRVRRGEFVSIVGPSGSGKSTLLHLLGGLATPTRGRVLVDGQEISRDDDSARTRVRREKIGFVFQRFNLLPTLTVRGNLEIVRQIQGNGPLPPGRLEELLRFLLPAYQREGKAYLTVAIGCTGGRHRSVYVAEALKRQLAGVKGVTPRVRHRDMTRQSA